MFNINILSTQLNMNVTLFYHFLKLIHAYLFSGHRFLQNTTPPSVSKALQEKIKELTDSRDILIMYSSGSPQQSRVSEDFSFSQCPWSC